jgi:molybdopterin converting factor small subunit
MPLVTVTLPDSLTAPEPRQTIEAEAETVRELLVAVADERPALASRLLFEGRPLVSVIRNGSMLPPHRAMTTELAAGDRLELLPPVAGG